MNSLRQNKSNRMPFHEGNTPTTRKHKMKSLKGSVKKRNKRTLTAKQAIVDDCRILLQTLRLQTE